MAKSVSEKEREQWALEVAARAGRFGEVQYTVSGDTLVIALVGDGEVQVLDCVIRQSWDLDVPEL